MIIFLYTVEEKCIQMEFSFTNPICVDFPIIIRVFHDNKKVISKFRFIPSHLLSLLKRHIKYINCTSYVKYSAFHCLGNTDSKEHDINNTDYCPISWLKFLLGTCQ